MDSARRERQRELARERQRRRRADPELREKEIQRRRQRREAAIAEFREKEAKAMRRRRKANPELREKEAEQRRLRRERLRATVPPLFLQVSLPGSGYGQQRHHTPPHPLDSGGETSSRPVSTIEAPCLHHSHGQPAVHLACVSRMMLPCTCGKELNGASTSQQMVSETTSTIKTEPEENAASDEEFFEMPLAVEMGIGEEPSNPPVAIKDEPLDIPPAPTENAGEMDEILGVTGIETLVLAAKSQAKDDAEDK